MKSKKRVDEIYRRINVASISGVSCDNSASEYLGLGKSKDKIKIRKRLAEVQYLSDLFMDELSSKDEKYLDLSLEQLRSRVCYWISVETRGVSKIKLDETSLYSKLIADCVEYSSTWGYLDALSG